MDPTPPGALAAYLARTASSLAPLEASHRLFPAYLALTVLVALLLYARRRRGVAGFLRWVVPGAIWRHRSTRLDGWLYVANAVLRPGFVAGTSVAGAALAVAIASKVGPAVGVAPRLTWSPLAVGAFSLSLFALRDLAHWLVHLAHHRIALLWPLHAVHHSAEVLTPLTLYRKHPLYDVLRAPVEIGVVGVFQAAVLLGFGTIDALWAVAGVNVFHAAFLAAGANLRHSHVWWDWGWLDYVLISPAQHQIHHSTAPEHQDRNFGSVLAIWDWAAGTLYVPDGEEALTFGLPDEEPHTGLADALWRPLRQAARRAMGR